MPHAPSPPFPASHGTADPTSGRLVVFGQRARLHLYPAQSRTVRVLIADGHALVRAGCRALLERHGRISVVGEASSGDEAVVLSARLRPDVVLIDATVPGLDCVRAIGRMHADSAVAVMLLAASEHDERIFAALRAGARGLVLNDTEPSELARAVEVLARGDALLSPSLTRRLIAELAASPPSQLPCCELLDELTAREREVVVLVALGLSNEGIAERLVISPATAKTHVSRAMVKVHARDRAQLVALAYHAGFVIPRRQPTATAHAGASAPAS